MNTSYFNAVYAMGSIGETLLAAPGSVTCIVDGDQSIISGCVAHILENIDIEHSVGHVINSALQCHHDNYHSCTKSLLVMTAMWLREMDSLVQQGVPLDAVLEGFHQAIDRCVQQLQCTKIAVGDILSSREPRQRSCTGDGNSGDILDSSCDRLNIDNSGRMLDDSSCDRLHSDNSGRMLDDSSCDRLHSDNSGRMLDDSSCDRLHSDNSGRMLDDSSCDRLHSDNSGRMLDDSSCDRLHSDNSGRMLVDNLCNSLHDHQSEHTETSNAASKNVKPTILPQSHNDIGDDDDDISWYFDDLNLNSPDDDALEMLMNTMGGMQQKLGCFTDDDTTSCRDRSGHVVSCDQSGDISPTVSSGVPILGTTSSIGGDKGMQPDTLSPQEEKTKCQRNQTSANESLVSDKQAKLLSIMEELSQTSKLLVKCNQAISSHAGPSVSSASDSNANRSSNAHPIAGSILDSNNGSISNCDTDSVVGSNRRSLIHNAENMNPNLKSDVDFSRSAECESGISYGFVCNANVRSKYDGSSRAKKNGSKFTSDSTHVTSVSAHPEDSDDEFSSCFDDVEIHAENAKRKKQFGDAVLPPYDQNGVPSADSDMLNGSRHFRSFQSLRRVSSTQESCCSTTSETMCLKSSRHLRNTNNNHAPLEDRTLRTMSPSEVVTITTSGCHCNTLGDTPAKSHVDIISTEESWDDHPCKISNFIHCLGQGCEDILDAVTETMLRQLKSDQLKPDENLRFEVSRVHTLTSVGPMRWDVIDGLVMETDMTQLSLLSASARPRRVLLVNGDVSLGFHHQGFTERTKTSVVSTVLTPDTKNQSWLDDTSSILSELEVGGILVRGSVSGEFKELCYTRRIVVFDRVPYKVLQGMAESCLKEPTVYISEATEDNVADDVIIRPWSCDWMDHLLTSVSYALVQPGLSLVQTVIILHPCCNVAKMKEEKYWHCAHRLHNMLTDGAVLPGGGATEQACVAMLQCDKSRNCQDENNLFSSLAGQHVAAALENFVQLVHRNSSFAAPDQWNHDIDQTEGNTVYDCLSAKLEAWRTAEYLVGVVLGADMEVVTGVGKNFIRAQRGDILGHV